MAQFLLKRGLAIVPLLLGVSIIVFLMVQLVPGDPVALMLGEFSVASVEDRERLRDELGLNDPLPVQYWNYFKNLVRGDLGDSMRSRKPVAEVIAERLPSTLELTLAGLLIAVVMGVGLGLLAALNHNTWVDNLSVAVALLGVSIPSFWLGLLLILGFAVHLNWFPVLGSGGLHALVLPALTLGIWAAGDVARLTRSGVLEIVQQDFVRTARSKGMPQRQVVLKHMLRNALIPVVTMLGIRFGQVLAGTVIIETVFSRPGLGLTLINAILAKDFPLVQGIVLFVAAAYVIVNFLVEAAYTWLDPRISYA